MTIQDPHDIPDKPIDNPTRADGSPDQPLLVLDRVTKDYGQGEHRVQALRGITLKVYKGEFVAVMGPSGSGKTTLLNCISTVDRPTGGDITLQGRSLGSLQEPELAAFRNRYLGFLFQEYNLLDTLTSYENIHLPMAIANIPHRQAHERITELSQQLGIETLWYKFPSQLSGGERQRVAAARAFVMEPALLLADEPTGALDTQTSRHILELLRHMQEDLGATIIMVTHSQSAASYASRVLFLRDGLIDCEVRRDTRSQEQFFEHLMERSTTMGGMGE